MDKMTRHVRIRITEDQFRKLADVLIEEQSSKSEIIREALHNYIEDKYHRKKSEQKIIKPTNTGKNEKIR